jgi:hypothetical protein
MIPRRMAVLDAERLHACRNVTPFRRRTAQRSLRICARDVALALIAGRQRTIETESIDRRLKPSRYCRRLRFLRATAAFSARLSLPTPRVRLSRWFSRRLVVFTVGRDIDDVTLRPVFTHSFGM